MPVFSLAPKSKPVVKPAILSDNAARILSPDIGPHFQSGGGIVDLLGIRQNLRCQAVGSGRKPVAESRAVDMRVVK